MNRNLRPQVRHSLSCNVLADTNNLHSNLWHLLELSNLSNVGIGRLSRSELASTVVRPAGFGILSWARIFARAGLEDGGFAGGKARGGHVEDQRKALGGLCNRGHREQAFGLVVLKRWNSRQ